MKRFLLLLLTALAACNGVEKDAAPTEPDSNSVLVIEKVTKHEVNNTSKFVVVTDIAPEIRVELRYYSNNNFMGRRMDGYQQEAAIATREASLALKKISDSLMHQGLALKIYDAYRPKRAVRDICRWSNDTQDTISKQQYYPKVEKRDMFACGYLSSRSNHCHGSTVDVTLVNAATNQELDMGTGFDLMDERSHYSYPALTEEQKENRKLLRQIMAWGGFSPIETEWWHFKLKNEPYGESFDFAVNRDSII